jgi:hypothetical protein
MDYLQDWNRGPFEPIIDDAQLRMDNFIQGE